MKKILIVRLSALGDIVHALPVLNALRKKFPDAEIDWLVEENYAATLSLAAGLHRRIIVRATSNAESADTISFAGVPGYLRAAADSGAGDAVGGATGQVLPVEDDPTFHLRKQTGDRPEQRRLAGAVRADDRHGLTGANLDVDVVDDAFAEIPGRNA